MQRLGNQLPSFLIISLACQLCGAAALAGYGSRYDRVWFVCQSIDPSGSRLNLRTRPHGDIKDTISKKEVFYVWGQELRHPVSGYVPVHFVKPGHAKAGLSAGARPGGWVWKAYVTCELSN